MIIAIAPIILPAPTSSPPSLLILSLVNESITLWHAGNIPPPNAQNDVEIVKASPVVTKQVAKYADESTSRESQARRRSNLTVESEEVVGRGASSLSEGRPEGTVVGRDRGVSLGLKLRTITTQRGVSKLIRGFFNTTSAYVVKVQ